MFVKLTKSGPRSYVQLVEAYRDGDGRPRQRTVATLGRLDQLEPRLESVIEGLMRVTGKQLPAAAAPASPKPAKLDVKFEATRTYGDIWTLTELWCQLGFDDLQKVFKRTRHEIDVEALIRVMVFNRLCDPQSKLGVLRWLETVAWPGELGTVTHQHLLRAMDALVDRQVAVDKVLVGLLRPLVDQDISLVFYDMTAIRAEGSSQEVGDVRKFGMSKEGVIARQFMLGVVQTADGLPLYHEVFDGNTAEVATLMPVVEKIVQRFPVKRIIVVADRGLLSIDNLDDLLAITLPSGTPLEFILAVPGRRYAEFVDLLQPFHQKHCAHATVEVLGEVKWHGQRMIIAHNPEVSKEAGAKRDGTIKELERKAAEWVTKLDDQDTGKEASGRKETYSGISARFKRAVGEAHLSKIIITDSSGALFTYRVDERALAHAQIMDGKLLMVTNATDLTPAEVLKRYKSLADIERGFRVLKSEIEIGPVFHRLPNRIRAHAAICFIALILYRVMRARLYSKKSNVSPWTALDILTRIQHHRVTINESEPVTGLSSINKEQTDILAALAVTTPIIGQQLSLL